MLATPFVFGGTLLTDEELDTVGAAGTVVTIPGEGETPIPLSDDELEKSLVKGSIPRFIWPFQYIPEGTSHPYPITGGATRLPNTNSNPLFPKYDPNNPSPFWAGGSRPPPTGFK